RPARHRQQFHGDRSDPQAIAHLVKFLAQGHASPRILPSTHLLSVLATLRVTRHGCASSEHPGPGLHSPGPSLSSDDSGYYSRARRLGLALVVAGVVAALLVVAAAVVTGIVLAAARGTLIAAAAILALLVVRGVLAPQLLHLALEDAHGLAHVAGQSRQLAGPEQEDHQQDEDDDRPEVAEEIHERPFQQRRGHARARPSAHSGLGTLRAAGSATRPTVRQAISG